MNLWYRYELGKVNAKHICVTTVVTVANSDRRGRGVVTLDLKQNSSLKTIKTIIFSLQKVG